MDTLQRALADVERELRDTELELERLTARVTYLRQAAAGLRGLVGQSRETVAEQSGDARPEPPAGSPTLATVEIPVGVSLEIPTEIPTGGTATPDSTAAARMIVKETPDQDVHTDDVREAFRARGWVPRTWTNPDAAIYAALKRAVKQDDRLKRTGRQTWRYVLAGDPDQPIVAASMDPAPHDAAAVNGQVVEEPVT